MRVVAGRLGGRRLRAPAGAATRPTAERSREALFSILGDVGGARVLDLFAGSGALGIEALSRGAAQAVFVERNAAAVRVLGENLDALGLREPVASVRRQDVLAGLRTARSRGETYDLVFIDPPYEHAGDLADRLAAHLAPLLAPGARVVAESDRRTPLELPWAASELRRYGDTLLHLHHLP